MTAVAAASPCDAAALAVTYGPQPLPSAIKSAKSRAPRMAAAKRSLAFMGLSFHIG